MTLLITSIVGLMIAALGAIMFSSNLTLFCARMDDVHPPENSDGRISVLIPARDEAAGIEQSVRAALQSGTDDIEVVVLDDHSADATADIVRGIARQDSRVRLVSGETLPPGWNGKQYACLQLASAAAADRLVFLDADVRLLPDSLTKLSGYQDETHASLLSAFPRQITETWLERWLIPMMHYILLCFLPVARMRSSNIPAYAAGCGQLFMTCRTDYQKAGTHGALRSSRHDGLKLPRVYREAGLMTDVIDGTDLASCRMYGSSWEVVRGVLKNAIEGIAHPRLIVPFSLLLLGGSVLPVLTLLAAVMAWSRDGSWVTFICCIISAVAVVLGHLPRAIGAVVFQQPWSGVVFHSAAVLLFVSLQWVALANHLTGRQVQWRGRIETAACAALMICV